MRTELPAELLATDAGGRADAILRSCVHCGFCNATCPTYQLLGDELDGPRGRIYLIKDMLESGDADVTVQTHLDRCLTCRACETTCPSGVRYGELLEIGRSHLEARQRRGWLDRRLRSWLLSVVPRPERFRRWLRLGRLARPILPRRLAAKIPPLPRRHTPAAAPGSPAFAPGGRSHGAEAQSALASTAALATGAVRRVVLLEGCVQSVTTPEVNARLRELLARRGIEARVSPNERCCGALALHLGADAEARATMAANAEAIGAELAEAEAVISTASGCGVTVKDYGRLLAASPHAATAAHVASKTLDVAEFLHGLGGGWQPATEHRRVAWHAPCTLQHGQRLGPQVESMLRQAGYELTSVADAHLCCGSAGSYSILQPELAERLRQRKLEALGRGRPDVIATANVGCQLHLDAAAGVPVVHWLELIR